MGIERTETVDRAIVISSSARASGQPPSLFGASRHVKQPTPNLPVSGTAQAAVFFRLPPHRSCETAEKVRSTTPESHRLPRWLVAFPATGAASKQPDGRFFWQKDAKIAGQSE